MLSVGRHTIEELLILLICGERFKERKLVRWNVPDILYYKTFKTRAVEVY